MKKLILVAFFATIVHVGYGQWFAQGSFGLILIEPSEAAVGTTSFTGGKSISFQAGKFVREDKMRSVFMSYDFGLSTGPTTMAVTRLKRKDRKNKVVSVLKKQNRKLQTAFVSTESPYKGQSGVIIEE